MTDRRLLAVVLYGSQLYGTATEASDIDLKAIFMPTLDELLLKSGRMAAPTLNNLLLSRKAEWEGKPVEMEYFTLHEFVRLAVGGQTMALDMLHAPATHVLHSSPIWEALQANTPRCISKNMSAFMGYARGQAMKYSAKGDRLDVLKDVDAFLKVRTDSLHQTIAEHWEAMQQSTWGNHKQIRFLEATPNSNNQRIFEVCGLQLMEGVTLKYALGVVTGAITKYGTRAAKAAAEGGADWKALSHAIRITGEISQLATTGKLTFPLENAESILAIKNGQVELPLVLKLLDTSFDVAEARLGQSSLPEKVDAEWWQGWLLDQVRGFYDLR